MWEGEGQSVSYPHFPLFFFSLLYSPPSTTTYIHTGSFTPNICIERVIRKRMRGGGERWREGRIRDGRIETHPGNDAHCQEQVDAFTVEWKIEREKKKWNGE